MIYVLSPEDDSSDSWLFFEDDAKGRLVVREEYRDLRCRACGKIDEEIALQRGISPRFAIRSRRDVIATGDDRICVSSRFRDLIASHAFEGLDFIPIPESDRFLLIPVCLVKTDELRAGFENHQKCSVCERFGERIIGPMIDGMEIPDSSKTFFSSAIANENVKVSYRPLFSSEAIVSALKAAKVSGIDYTEAW